MDYYEGLIKNTEFLTTTELAEKLKMNVQVITRKVQSGEIHAYKIGKDWRIPEQAVFDWLETHSNKPKGKPEITKNSTTIIRKQEKEPAAPMKIEGTVNNRKHFLEYILAHLEPNRLYQEDEFNRIIGRFNDDHTRIREEFLTSKMVEIVSGKIRRRSQYRLSDV